MRTISINIAGTNFQIRSDLDEDYVETLAGEITERFSAIKPKGARAEQDLRAMTLVALGVLDDLHKTRTKHQALRKKTREFVQRMISRLDRLLGA